MILKIPKSEPLGKGEKSDDGSKYRAKTGDSLAKIAKQNGIEAVILESHKNWIEKNPIKSIQMSAEFLKNEFQK